MIKLPSTSPFTPFHLKHFFLLCSFANLPGKDQGWKRRKTVSAPLNWIEFKRKKKANENEGKILAQKKQKEIPSNFQISSFYYEATAVAWLFTLRMKDTFVILIFYTPRVHSSVFFSPFLFILFHPWCPISFTFMKMTQITAVAAKKKSFLR